VPVSLSRNGEEGCGCFGALSTPLYGSHGAQCLSVLGDGVGMVAGYQLGKHMDPPRHAADLTSQPPASARE
jgi:hypothetical protein